jgi:AbrB family looped-hinge helix DNA binding protein
MEVLSMETSVTKKGQTNIPAVIRKRHHIKEGDRLVWLDDGEIIRVVPIPADPLRALRGTGKGEGLLNRLLQHRHKDKERGS